MLQPLPTNSADAAALVQQFLMFHGGRYSSRATEENWKVVPVTLSVPSNPSILEGEWLVVPWEAPTQAHLELWLQRLSQAGPLPKVAVLAMDHPYLEPALLRQLSYGNGMELIAITAEPPAVYGSRAADQLRAVLDDDERERFAHVNPLDHLISLGDPREPQVFLERLRRAAPGVPVTRAFITLNVLIFMAMVAVSGSYGQEAEALNDTGLLGVLLGGFSIPQLQAWGANTAPLTVGPAGAWGEPWRLMSSAFLHGNLLHIGMNLLVLRQLGDTAERLFGSRAYAAVYLLSALAGSVASLGWHALQNPLAVSVGASGAVFGVMGATLGFALARKEAVPRRVYKALLSSGLWFAGINIAFGLSMSMVDNAAHIGGLLAGVLSGAALSRELPPAPQPSARRQIAVVTAFVLVLAVLFRVASGLWKS
jgi:membrane associated rhomboid family serine protease